LVIFNLHYMSYLFIVLFYFNIIHDRLKLIWSVQLSTFTFYGWFYDRPTYWPQGWHIFKFSFEPTTSKKMLLIPQSYGLYNRKVSNKNQHMWIFSWWFNQSFYKHSTSIANWMTVLISKVQTEVNIKICSIDGIHTHSTKYMD